LILFQFFLFVSFVSLCLCVPSSGDQRKGRDSNPQRDGYRYLFSGQAPRPAGPFPKKAEATGIEPARGLPRRVSNPLQYRYATPPKAGVTGVEPARRRFWGPSAHHEAHPPMPAGGLEPPEPPGRQIYSLPELPLSDAGQKRGGLIVKERTNKSRYCGIGLRSFESLALFAWDLGSGRTAPALLLQTTRIDDAQRGGVR
jgi:hypothetical protein